MENICQLIIKSTPEVLSPGERNQNRLFDDFG
jgi:hypothetical protein